MTIILDNCIDVCVCFQLLFLFQKSLHVLRFLFSRFWASGAETSPGGVHVTLAFIFPLRQNFRQTRQLFGFFCLFLVENRMCWRDFFYCISKYAGKAGISFLFHVDIFQVTEMLGRNRPVALWFKPTVFFFFFIFFKCLNLCVCVCV